MQMEINPSLPRAVWAVGRRQLITFVRYPSWMIGMCIWPVLLPFAHVFASRALAGPDNMALGSFAALAGSTDYAAFIAIGTTFWMWFNAMLWGLGSALRMEQMRGTLESNWLVPVPKMFLLLGSFWAEALMGLVTLCIAYTALYFVWGVRVMGSVLHLALVVLASVPSIYGVGMIFASLVLVAKETNALIFFVRGLITVFCGITYPIGVMPDWMKAISSALPLTHSIKAVRAIVAGQALSDVTSELSYVLMAGVVLLVAGYLCFEVMQRHLLKTGTIGQY